jgi:excisionase family DNA binding protein
MGDMSNRASVNTEQHELLTVKEVAVYFRVSRVTAWRWCQQGIVPAFRIGHHWRIRRDALEQLLETHDYQNLPENREIA